MLPYESCQSNINLTRYAEDRRYYASVNSNYQPEPLGHAGLLNVCYAEPTVGRARDGAYASTLRLPVPTASCRPIYSFHSGHEYLYYFDSNGTTER